jgi:hypothetical protein
LTVHPKLLGEQKEGLIVAGSMLVANLVAVEEKSWWRWAWAAVTSLGADTSHYVVHWSLWLLVVGVGVGLACKIGRAAPGADSK